MRDLFCVLLEEAVSSVGIMLSCQAVGHGFNDANKSLTMKTVIITMLLIKKFSPEGTQLVLVIHYSQALLLQLHFTNPLVP